MVAIYLFMVMLCLTNAYGYLRWEVAKKASYYGDDLSLYCNVQHCCQESAGWIQWTSQKEFLTIFIDVKNLSVPDSYKYNGKLNTYGFYLVIRKVTRKDFNVNYSCTYGFHVSKKQLLLETDAFVAKPQITEVSSNDGKSKGLTSSVSWIVIANGLGIFWLLPVSILAVCVFCFKDRIMNSIERVVTHHDRHDPSPAPTTEIIPLQPIEAHKKPDEDLDSCEFDEIEESTINICTQKENISTTSLIDTILGTSEEVEYLRKCKSLAKNNPGNQTFTEQYESVKKTIGFKLLDKYKQMKTKNALQQKTKHILERWDISTEF